MCTNTELLLLTPVNFASIELHTSETQRSAKNWVWPTGKLGFNKRNWRKEFQGLGTYTFLGSFSLSVFFFEGFSTSSLDLQSTYADPTIPHYQIDRCFLSNPPKRKKNRDSHTKYSQMPKTKDGSTLAKISTAFGFLTENNADTHTQSIMVSGSGKLTASQHEALACASSAQIF
jgi:hypothetical protein